MQYPVPDSTLPPEKTLLKNQRYFFPFRFPVPDQLPSTSCQHPVDNDFTRQTHLQAPPSFGDPDVAGFGGKLRNDYAPSNCRIVYTIQARLTRLSIVTETKQTILQKSLKIRLKPYSAQVLIPPPPLSPPAIDNEEENQPQQTIDIHQRDPKSKSKIKIGQLKTIIIAPPRFDVPVREADASVRQAIRLNLHFTRENHQFQRENTTDGSGSTIQPNFLPQIQSLKGSVVASTFFTKGFNTDIPRKQKDRLGTKLNYADKILTEFTHAIASLQWASETRNHIQPDQKLDPDSTAGPASPTDNVTGTGTADNANSFTSTLLVPVKLSHQFIIPTFHSCRVSRTYTLVLRLKVQGAATIEIVAPMVIAPSEETLRPPPYSSSTSTFGEMQVIDGVEEGEEEESVRRHNSSSTTNSAVQY